MIASAPRAAGAESPWCKREQVPVDPATEDVGMAVVVGHRSPVLLRLRVPAGNPVQLPTRHEGAIGKELVLPVVTDDPQAVLDEPMDTFADRGHGRAAGAEGVRFDRAGPGDVAVEACERRHLGSCLERHRDHLGLDGHRGSDLSGEAVSRR